MTWGKQLTGIGPIDPRVPHKGRHRAVPGVEGHNGILLDVAHVNQPVAVRLEPIAQPLLPVVPHALLRQHLARRAPPAQQGGGDAVQPPRAQGTPEQALAVGRDGNAVGAEAEVREGPGQRAAVLVHGQPAGEAHEARVGPHALRPVEVAPDLARAEVGRDQAVAALDAAVGDVGQALAAFRAAGSEVEAHVVEVGVLVGDGLREQDGLDDRVGCEVDSDELGAAVRGRDEGCAVGIIDPASIENP